MIFTELLTRVEGREVRVTREEAEISEVVGSSSNWSSQERKERARKKTSKNQLLMHTSVKESMH